MTLCYIFLILFDSQCIYIGYFLSFPSLYILCIFKCRCLFWMAPPSTSQQRQPQTESFQPSTIRSNRRQKEPCSSHPQVAPSTPLPQIPPPPPSNVLSQIQIETSVSQPLENSSTLQPTHKIPSHARRPRPVASGCIITYMMKSFFITLLFHNIHYLEYNISSL
jgi:hypothetical protein